MYVCMHLLCMYLVCTYVCIHVCMSVCVGVHLYMYACMYIQKYICCVCLSVLMNLLQSKHFYIHYVAKTSQIFYVFPCASYKTESLPLPSDANQVACVHCVLWTGGINAFRMKSQRWFFSFFLSSPPWKAAYKKTREGINRQGRCWRCKWNGWQMASLAIAHCADNGWR